MKKTIVLALLLAVSEFSTAQTCMRDIFASLPDSILPLMTHNNRLDCIDFIENDMEARVKNRFDSPVVLEALTADYLRICTGETSLVEMKMVAEAADTLIYVARTYSGPAADSEVMVYGPDWNVAGRMERPRVEEFMKNRGATDSACDAKADTLDMIRAEAEFMPLMKASLSPDTDEIVWTLQTEELSKPLKAVAEGYLQPVVRKAGRDR